MPASPAKRAPGGVSRLRPSCSMALRFADGEHKARPLMRVAGRDICVLAGLHGDPSESRNDRLCRPPFFVAALSGAASVTVVAPYLCCDRKDRRTKPGDPVTSRYVAHLFEGVVTSGFITVDASGCRPST